MRSYKQLHAHGRDFSKFYWRLTIVHEGLITCGEHVESMSSLMHQCTEVRIAANGIHEDERKAAFAKVALITAWRLALPALQVQQVLVGHEPELLRKRRMNAGEDFPGAIDEFC